MPSEETAKPRTLANVMVQFLSGAGLGLLLVLVPLSYVWLFSISEVNAAQIIVSAAFVVLCGTLSAIWGDKVIDTLVKVLEAAP